MSPGLPKRWLDYTNIGTQIENTRLIPLKVPLSESFNGKIKEQDRFGIPELLEGIPNLGLLIDLTNTDKYYNSKELLDRGIEYVKIYTKGQKIPSKRCYWKIAKIINSFLAKNAINDRLIGVHCTHGINRTGYLICAYLILNNKWPVINAIENFEKARNHKIEREPYIRALHNLGKNLVINNMHKDVQMMMKIFREPENQNIKNSFNYQRRTNHIENWRSRSPNRNEYSSNYHRRHDNEEDNWQIRSEPIPIHNPNQNTNNPYSWRRQN